MIALFTDFGADDIYVGQMKAALLQHAPGAVILDVLHSAPNYDARAAAHVLAALRSSYPPGTVFLGVIDPGVGSERGAVVVEADGQWFVGPDNGLFSVIAARAAHARTWRIMWRPANLSASFHGRDLFAPVAAWVSVGSVLADKLVETTGLDVQLGADELAEVIYIDHYGNVLTGLHSQALLKNARVRIGAREVAFARTFAEAPAGAAFWYGNSIGLLEVAVNRGHAASQLGIRVGDRVQVMGLEAAD